ncbi:MAG: M16 family metallopeptidase [Anaerolineae bacterium]
MAPNRERSPILDLLRTTLGNGLQILIQEAQTAPVVSFWIWYRVGSRNEHVGITGISHWVEHMLFKGTERWPQGAADHAIAREGGVQNGMTWYDFTTFYETLPADKLPLALDIEADRMQNARYSEEAVNSERSVVISERQGRENSPHFLLGEEISATAYRVHPYGHETIGHLCDLQAITTEDLRHHYETYYTPNNAIVGLAGDVNVEEAERLIERMFGDLQPGPEPPAVTAFEPPQRGERRVVVEGAGQTDYLEVAYHVPEAAHADFYALTVLNAILSGGSGFLIGRGHITNHTSRLYNALVETEHAVDVNGNLTPTVDPGLYRLMATVWPGTKPETVAERIEDEIARIREDPVSEDELAKAQRQARALFAYSSESITHQAFWLGFAEIFADRAWFTTYLERLSDVTAEDVQRVAQTYLIPQNRTTGWYVGSRRST